MAPNTFKSWFLTEAGLIVASTIALFLNAASSTTLACSAFPTGPTAARSFDV